MQSKWFTTNEGYRNRSRVLREASHKIISWVGEFVEFHCVSNGLALDVGSGTGFFCGLPEEDSEYCYYEGDKVSLDPFICRPVRGGIIGVGEFLPFRGDFFDIIFCVSSFSHMIDPSACIKEIYRVLRKRGRFFVGAMSDRCCDVYHLWFPSTDELKRILSLPFEIKKFRYDSRMCMFELVKLASLP